MKPILLVLGLLFCFNLASAQFDKASVAEALKGKVKSNDDFKQMYVKTLDGERFSQKFDITWLKDFKFYYMEAVLDIRYETDKGEFHIYIPYAEILTINTSKSGANIVIKE